MNAPVDEVKSGAQVAPRETDMEASTVATGKVRAESAPKSNVRTLKPKREFALGDHPEMATALLRLLPSSGVAPVDDLGAIHTYSATSGIWTRVEKSDASKIVQGFSGGTIIGEGKPKALRLRKTDVHGTIELAQDQARRKGFFDGAARGLAFANGFVRMKGGKIGLEPHAPEHAARHGYSFDYKPSECSKWLACLADAFRGDDDAAEKIACLQEFAGASLFGIAPKYQRAIVGFGVGDNAKSTIATIIRAAFPIGSTCAVPPQTFGSEYRMALIAGKLLNVVNELPEAEILAGETFKAMITGDEQTARPIREQPFTFHAIAGHLYNANRFPGTNDQTHGFWRRLIVITYNRTFTDAEKDADLADKIVAAELAGIVAWMVEGAQRLLAQGHYTIPPSSERAIATWRRGSDPVAQFVQEKTEPARTLKERTPAKTLFEAYTRWAQANFFKVMSSSTFGVRMRGLKSAGGESLGSTHTEKCEVYPLVLVVTAEEAEYSGFGRAGIGEGPPREQDPDDVAREWMKDSR